MKTLRWYFKNGTRYDEYSVLYEDDSFILVYLDNYSFGLKRDFGTLFGFPVNWSCLTADELKTVLNGLIKIDTSYIKSLGDIAKNNIQRWENMLKAAKENEQ